MTDFTVQPVILAGGSGTRLWPLSRESFPKQLLRLRGAGTLLQDTVRRLDGLDGGPSTVVREPIVVCNEEHRFLVLDQIEAIERAPEAVVLEPVGRNTAPALCLAAELALAAGTDPVLLVMPADHVIEDREAFHAAAASAARLAAEGAVVTFGIVPTRPETGFGYLRTGAAVGAHEGAFQLEAFVEKPDAETAGEYLASGEYLWNSGMFVVRASVWRSAARAHCPDIATACAEALRAAESDGRFVRVGRRAFEGCRADSIDYAVMEPLSAAEEAGEIWAAVVALDAGWSDIGSWSALLEIGEGDEAGNVLEGDVFTHQTRDSLVIAGQRLVATLGVRDLVVVDTADAVLVARKDCAQDVRRVVGWLEARGREEGKSHRRVYRPWGSYEQLDAGERYQVKRLTVKPGAALSLQMHHHRAEHWVVVRGTARVTRGEEVMLLGENESTFIPLGTRHRLENPGKVELEVIEVQSGSYLGEDDIVRFEDRYDR